MTEPLPPPGLPPPDLVAPLYLAASPTGPALDRAAQRRTDPAWLELAWPQAQVIVIDNGRALCVRERLVLLPAPRAPAGPRYFLGLDAAGTPYFAVVAAHDTLDALDEPAQPRGIRDVVHRLAALEADLLMTAVALANWHERHQFSPSSGRPTSVGDGGWVRSDDAGEMVWPRTDPAVIVLVHDDVPGPAGRCLLARNAAWPSAQPGDIPRFSCLAGFVEPGETVEQTLLREVAEEVGLGVHSLSYVASQPWPYPGSLMLGFHAVADPQHPLRLDPAEIVEARWFTREEIRAVIAGAVGASLGISSPASIAYHLIALWLHR